jgi:hypothetical protein
VVENGRLIVEPAAQARQTVLNYALQQFTRAAYWFQDASPLF